MTRALRTGTVLASALGAAALALSACAPSAPAGTAPATATQDPAAPLTVWVDDTRQAPAQAYAAAHPEVKIDVEVIDSAPGTSPSRISLANNAGSGWPDLVFLGNPDEISSLAANPLNFALPLGGTAATAALGGFAPGSVERCTYDGQAYCLPNDLAPTVLFYDKQQMQQFGYPVPTTFEQYRALGERVAAEHPGYVLGTVQGRYGIGTFYGSSGCPVAQTSSPTQVRINVSAPECTRVDDVIGPMVANGSLSTLDPFDPNFSALLAAGKVLAFPAPAWMGDFGFAPTFTTPGRIAAAPMPTWSGETTPYSGTVGGGLWVVSRHSANQAAAVAMAVALATDPAIQVQASGLPADRASAQQWLARKATDTYYAQDPGPVLQQAAAQVNPASGYVRYASQLTDSFDRTVVAKAGTDIAGGLAAWGEQAVSAAQGAGYTVGR